MDNIKHIIACFFKSEVGNEPVRDFLKSMSIEDKKSNDIASCNYKENPKDSKRRFGFSKST